MKSPDAIICEAYERHLSENHQADYEVCEDLACQLAYALERLNWPLYRLVVAGLEMSGVAAQKDVAYHLSDGWHHEAPKM